MLLLFTKHKYQTICKTSMQGEKEVLGALTSFGKKSPEPKKEPEPKVKEGGYFWLAFALIFLVVCSTGIMWLAQRGKTYSRGEVHWHAYIDLNICGQKVDLPCPETSGIVHGEEYCGTPMLHHHRDNTLHIEGRIKKKEDIALGKFFDAINETFDKDKILDKKNGDLCPDGRPGLVKMYVNGQPRTDFRDYIPFASQDERKQIINITFEP